MINIYIYISSLGGGVIIRELLGLGGGMLSNECPSSFLILSHIHLVCRFTVLVSAHDVRHRTGHFFWRCFSSRKPSPWGRYVRFRAPFAPHLTGSHCPQNNGAAIRLRRSASMSWHCEPRSTDCSDEWRER